MTIDKPLRWLAGEIKTPPLSASARIEAGVLLRRLQRGERLGSSQSRVAKIEAGDPSVSLDLLTRSMLALGASKRDIARVLER